MNRLTFLGAVNSYTGYGLHGIRIVRDLERLAGVRVNIRALNTSEAFGAKIPTDIRERIALAPQPEPWELLLHPPNFYPTPGKKTAYFTMWETTSLPHGGALSLNQASVIIVPCEFNAVAFSAGGVTAPIRIVNLGVDESIFRFSPVRLDHSRPITTVFGAAGRMAHGGVRKGINEVIDVFQKTFVNGENVQLRIKCFPDCNVSEVSDPRVSITKKYLSDEEMGKWMREIHCFVSMARGEGWGLLQHQAMAVGRPVISVAFGGVREFLNQSNALVVSHRLEPAQHSYAQCGLWAVPDPGSVAMAMTWVHDNLSSALRVGEIASTTVSNFTWSRHSSSLVSVLNEFGAL